MKRYSSLIFLSFAMISPLLQGAEEPGPSSSVVAKEQQIHWYTSLKEAQEKAKADNLPLYLCFTGPSWCFWCQRLEKEIHSSPLFIQKVHDKFIFTQINVPKEQTELDPELRDLMLKYEVYGVPVILILSPSGQKMGQLSYQSIAPEEFAELALTM